MGWRQVSTVLTAPAGGADRIWSSGWRDSLVVFVGFWDLLEDDMRFLVASDAKKGLDVDWERADFGVLRVLPEDGTRGVEALAAPRAQASFLAHLRGGGVLGRSKKWGGEASRRQTC